MSAIVRVSTRDLTKTFEVGTDEPEVTMRLIKPCNFYATNDSKTAHGQCGFADLVVLPRSVAEFIYHSGIAEIAQ